MNNGKNCFNKRNSFFESNHNFVIKNVLRVGTSLFLGESGSGSANMHACRTVRRLSAPALWQLLEVERCWMFFTKIGRDPVNNTAQRHITTQAYS